LFKESSNVTNKELMKQLWPKQKKQKPDKSPLLRSTNSLLSPGSSRAAGGGGGR